MIAPSPTPLRESVDPAVICLDPDLQSRDATDERVVSDYADQMRDGTTFPPVVLYYDGDDYWCADGWHRVLAARAAGLEEIDADVREGTRRDALRHSLGANTTHGLRRTSADKRRAVTIALADPEWTELSDREIARLCGVSHTFVAQLRRPRVATLPPPETSVARPPTDGEIVRATLACLDHGHRGEARLPELRASVEAQLGVSLAEADWQNAIARGAAQRLWDHTGKISAGVLIGTIESRTKRPQTIAPTSSPIPRSAPISTGGDPEPGGDREDGEQDPDEGPVLPEDPDDPAAQGHHAALEESIDGVERLRDLLERRGAALKPKQILEMRGEFVRELRTHVDDYTWDNILCDGEEVGLWELDATRETVGTADEFRRLVGTIRLLLPGADSDTDTDAERTSLDEGHDSAALGASESGRAEAPKPAAPTPSRPPKPRPSALPERLDPSLVDLRCESASHLLARLDDGEAALVIADPPWSYSQSHGASRADDHYPTLPLEDIAMHLRGAHRVGRRLALWITGALLGEWVAVKTPWGQPITAGSWVKSREGDEGHYGQGYHWAGSSELVLLYARDGSHTDRSSALRNAWIEERGEHSCKPIGWQTQWIRRWVPEGGLVVDLYAGLASVACATLLAGGGRRYIGAELDKGRHARALENIAALCAKEGA